eukprot:365344-Chlamydomonas_euryale.AAC.8
MVVRRPMTSPTFKLSGKELMVTYSFEYLGSFFADDGSVSRETDVQSVRALAAFVSFKIHGPAQAEQQAKNRSVSRVCFAHSLHGCETWTWTELQMAD